MLLSDFPEDILDIISSFHYSVFYNLCLTIKWYSVYKSHPLEQKRFKKIFTYEKTLSKDDHMAFLIDYRTYDTTDNILHKISNILGRYYTNGLISKETRNLHVGNIDYIKYKFLAGKLHSADDSNSVIILTFDHLLTFRHQYGKLESYQHKKGCLEPAVVMIEPYRIRPPGIKISDIINIFIINDKISDTFKNNYKLQLQEYFVNDKSHNYTGPSLISYCYDEYREGHYHNSIYKEYKRFGEYHHPIGITKKLEVLLKKYGLLTSFRKSVFRKPSVVTISDEKMKTCKWNYNNGDFPNVIVESLYNHPPKFLWLMDGKLHRVNGPAVLYGWNTGAEEWHLNGVRHRVGGPAITHLNGHKEWYINGKRHRDDGPAIEYQDGRSAWYKNGNIYKRASCNGRDIVYEDSITQYTPNHNSRYTSIKSNSLGYATTTKK